jgi:IS30 family transposase
MTYHQLTSGERYMLSALRKQGLSQAEIARALGRHRSTISRELRRKLNTRLRKRLDYQTPDEVFDQ